MSIPIADHLDGDFNGPIRVGGNRDPNDTGVDAARMPVYFVTEAHQLVQVWEYLAVGTIGVVIGTLVGQRVLVKIPARIFRRIVSLIILGLGIALVVHPNL